MLEMFADHEHFVKETFTRLVACKGVKSDFADEVSAVYKDFLTRDGNLSITAGLVTRPLFYRWMTSQYIALMELDSGPHQPVRNVPLGWLIGLQPV